jgi:hypothetical protein
MHTRTVQSDVQDFSRLPQPHACPPGARPTPDEELHVADTVVPEKVGVALAYKITERPHLTAVSVAREHEVKPGLGGGLYLQGGVRKQQRRAVI